MGELSGASGATRPIERDGWSDCCATCTQAQADRDLTLSFVDDAPR